MGTISLSVRIREFLASRRFLWILTILFGVLMVLYFLFVSFLFNPFEDDLEDIAQIVPREVDYFVRWKAAGEQFSDFPVPRIWGDLEDSAVVRRLREGGELQEWDQELGVARALEDLRSLAESAPVGVDLQTDFMREVAVAGKGSLSFDHAFNGVLLLRVSLKVKAGVSLLDYGFIRDKLPSSLAIEALPDNLYRLPQFEPFGFQDAYLARIRDVILLASREEWIQDARKLEVLAGQGSLAFSSNFSDNVTALLAPGDKTLEFYSRWETVAPRVGRFPDPSGSFWEQVASRFYSTSLMRVVAGYWLPGTRFEGRFNARVDLGGASRFQRAWFESHGLDLRRLKDFASKVPDDSFLYGGISGDPGKVFLQWFDSLDDESRRFLDELVVNTGKYQGTGDLLAQVGKALSPGLFLALHPNDYPPDPNDVPHDDAPVPLFLMLGTLRDVQEYEDLLQFFMGNAFRFAEGEERPKVQTISLRAGYSGFSFVSPAIPGTGEILVMRESKLVILSNSFKYVNALIDTISRMPRKPGPLSEMKGFQVALEKIRRAPNLFLFLKPSAARSWIDQTAGALAEETFLTDMESVFARERAAETERQRQRLFGQGAQDLSDQDQYRLTEAVDKALLERHRGEEEKQLPVLTDRFERSMLPLQLLDWVSLAMKMGNKEAGFFLTGHLALE